MIIEPKENGWCRVSMLAPAPDGKEYVLSWWQRGEPVEMKNMQLETPLYHKEFPDAGAV